MAKFKPKTYRRYNEAELQNLTRRELNALYREYRATANKRLAAIGKSEEFRESLTYRANIGQYDVAPSKLTRAELTGKIAQVSRMLSAVTGSLTGLREQANATVESLQNAGYNFITRENLREFGEFMEYARAKLGKKYYGSEQTADLYDIAQEKGISIDVLYREFETWRRNRNVLAQLPAGDYKTGADIRQALGIQED